MYVVTWINGSYSRLFLIGIKSETEKETLTYCFPNPIPRAICLPQPFVRLFTLNAIEYIIGKYVCTTSLRR